MLVFALAPHSVPLFLHDWAWPFDRNQAFQGSRDALLIWKDSGFGRPSGAPNAWFAAAAIDLGCTLIGPYPALIVFLTLIVGISLWATFALLRLLGAVDAAAAAGALAYAASPVVLNKLHAGHVFYLLGFAFLPVACCAIVASRDRVRVRGAILTGLSLAVAAEQFQMIAIGAVAVVFCGVAAHRRRAALPITVALLVALLLHLPDYVVMSQSAGAALLYPLLPTEAFELNLSSSFADALAQFAYFARYAVTGLGRYAGAWAAVVLLSDAVLCALAIAQLRTRPRASGPIFFVAFALTFTGAALASGYEGPLGLVVRRIFEMTPYATAFREFYDFSALTALGTAALIAAACGQLRGASRMALVPALAVVAAFSAAALGNRIQTDPAEVQRIERDVVTADGRVIYYPGSPALGAVGLPGQGLDPFVSETGASAPVTYATDPERTAYWYAMGASQVPAQASRFGWSARRMQADIVDRYLVNLDEPTRVRVLRTYRAPLRFAPGVEYFGNQAPVDAVLGTSNVAIGPPTWPRVSALGSSEHLLSPLPSSAPRYDFGSLGIDPSSSFVQSERWLPAFPDIACLPMPSVFRYDKSAVARGCLWHYERTGCLTLRSDGIQALGPCSAPGASEALATKARRVAAGELRVAYVRQAYDPRWRLDCGNQSRAPDVLVDAYAAGWFVRECENPTVSFLPDQTFSRLILVTLGVIAILLAALLGSMLRTRKARAT